LVDQQAYSRRSFDAFLKGLTAIKIKYME